MSISAAILDAMISAGATAEVIAAAVKADQLLVEEKASARRAKAAARQRLKRERTTMSREQGVTERDNCEQSVTKRDNAPLPSPPSSSPFTLPLITTPSPITRQTKRARRATRLPDDWGPSELDLAFAHREGLAGDDMRVEILKFKNHWAGKSGKDATKHDWSATWRNWVLNWKKFNGSRSGRSGERQRSSGDFLAGLASLATDIARDDSVARPGGEEIPFGRFNIDG